MEHYNTEKITTDSINRVPLAIIFNNKKYNEYVQYLSKKVLTKSMMQNNSMEVGILAALDGTLESRVFYGSTDSVDIHNNEEYISMIASFNIQSLLFVHNHPDNSTLSYSDLLNLIYDAAIKIVVAVGNRGDMYFAFKIVDNNIFYTQLYVRMTNYIFKVNDKIERIKRTKELYKLMLDNPSKFGIVLGKSNRKGD